MGVGIVEAVAELAPRVGVDLGRWGLAWARTAPVVAIVPAFGLRALPPPVRAAVALGLAACIAPSVGVAPQIAGGWAMAVVAEVLRGLPVAVAAAVPLWAATMAGGLADALRGAQESVSLPTLEGRTTPLGALLGLVAGGTFFASGGPARVASALLAPVPADPVLRAASSLIGGVGLAVALAAPLVAAAVVAELAAALVARVASPAQVHALLAPLRALVVLGAAAIALDRIVVVLAAAVAAG